MFVLQRHHRAQVVDGEVARVLNAGAECLLREQRGRGACHAAIQQRFLERVADACGDIGIASQHERDQPQRTLRIVGIRH